MSRRGSVEDVITDAKTPTETLSVAEVSETVKDESVAPVFVLCSGDSDRACAFVYLFHYVVNTVFHDQSHNAS